MTSVTSLHPLREANRITQMLDKVFGQDRFGRQPVDIATLALEYSGQVAPKSPIHLVEERDLKGCMGALVYSEEKPRQWGIAYHQGQSPGRRSFTIGHEFGHYVLHRDLIETDPRFEGGVYCDETSILRRQGEGLEKEADTFAAALLMPLHDFRRQATGQRYGVSLTAAILRWLEYTETRAIMFVSNEGFAFWSRSSDAAFKSGRFVRTKQITFELPAAAVAARREFTDETKLGVQQPLGVWHFPEPVLEMCIRSERYDQEITLLQFEGKSAIFHEEEPIHDTFDQFMSNDRIG